MRKKLALTAGIIAIMGLAACSTAPSGTTTSQTVPLNTDTTLQTYNWTLESVTAEGQTPRSAPTGLDGSPIILHFANNQVSVEGLCNLMNGGYTVNGDYIAVSQPISTRKMCADQNVMQYETDVGQLLPTANHWHVSGHHSSPMLTLSFANGTSWQLIGKPTLEALYGSTPEVVFLEVAAQREACSSPLIPNYQCLKVREIMYDSNGIKTKTGEWDYYYGDIQGYEHQPGIRNVIRIQRYTRPNPPADTSKYVDILDMVVESAQGV